MTDDYTLVRDAQGGSHKAFETLVRKYQRQIANLIYLSMGSRDDVEDLLQEVFVRAYRSLPRFKFDASFFSWLYRIGLNLCIDEIRKKKIRRIVSLDFLTEDAIENQRQEHSSLLSNEGTLYDERKEIIRDALQQLSMEHRQIILLREYEDLSYEEIAKTLHISVQAVKSRLFRARAELKELLKDYFKEMV